MKKHAPIVAVILLLLPMLYVGSYFALVRPPGAYYIPESTGMGSSFRTIHYRHGEVWAERIFWPLEQIDRMVRPAAWDGGIHDMNENGLDDKFPR